MFFQNEFFSLICREREEKKSYQAHHKDGRNKGPDKVIVEGNPATTERNNGEVVPITNKQRTYLFYTTPEYRRNKCKQYFCKV